MQSLEIDGLKEVIQTLETTPEVIRQARAEFFDEAGAVSYTHLTLPTSHLV